MQEYENPCLYCDVLLAEKEKLVCPYCDKRKEYEIMVNGERLPIEHLNETLGLKLTRYGCCDRWGLGNVIGGCP
jgi:uncharacterized Zn-finger protein